MGMHGNTRDITGQTFGRLTVVEYVKGGWACTCSCGGTIIARTWDLVRTRGPTKSCGCLAKAHSVALAKQNTGKTREKCNLVGNTYGRLTVMGYSDKRSPRATYWRCQCSCGGSSDVEAYNLTGGRIVSCGCLGGRHKPGTIAERAARREQKARQRAADAAKRKDETEFRNAHRLMVWRLAGMIARCERPTCPKYPDYGGRGIKVCDRWRFGEGGLSGLRCFVSDMGDKPKGKYSIDRWPDNDGDYEPNNCRWALPWQQEANKARGRSRKDMPPPSIDLPPY